MTEEQQNTTTEPNTDTRPQIVCIVTLQIEVAQALMQATGSTDPGEAIFAALGHCLMLDQFKRETAGEAGRARHVELIREAAKLAGLLESDTETTPANDNGTP